jgi:hypothetical protein
MIQSKKTKSFFNKKYHQYYYYDNALINNYENIWSYFTQNILAVYKCLVNSNNKGKIKNKKCNIPNFLSHFN